VSWLASGFGSKLGIETSAWMAPVFGSIATAAPRVEPTSLSARPLIAASWARSERVSTTFPPAVSSPVNMSRKRSAKSRSLVPARNSSSACSMPTAPMFTGLYPITCANWLLNG
jgi:hypothetical protein